MDTRRCARAAFAAALALASGACRPSEPLAGAEDVMLRGGGALTRALAELRTRVGGPLEALEVNVYGDYAIVQARRASRREPLAQYTLREGVVEGPIALKAPAGGTPRGELFSLDEVNFAAIPGLTKVAATALKLQHARPLRVSVQRSPGPAHEVRVRVHVESERASGRLDADAAGNALEAKLD